MLEVAPKMRANYPDWTISDRSIAAEVRYMNDELAGTSKAGSTAGLSRSGNTFESLSFVEIFTESSGLGGGIFRAGEGSSV